jgi:hypothetical protein
VNRGSGAQAPIAQSFVAASAPADTNEDTLATISVPALGTNSLIRLTTIWMFAGAGGTRTIRVRFSGAAGTKYLENAVAAARTGATVVTYIANANVTNAQIGSSVGQTDNGTGFQTAGAGNASSSVDTTVATTIVLTGQKASAGDTLTLQGFTAELINP